MRASVVHKIQEIVEACSSSTPITNCPINQIHSRSELWLIDGRSIALKCPLMCQSNCSAVASEMLLFFCLLFLCWRRFERVNSNETFKHPFDVVVIAVKRH